MSSSSMLSAVSPAMTECVPQELLPIMPPSVQRLWVAGSGPNVRSYLFAALRNSSSTIPGSTRARFASASSSTRRFMYLEKSKSTPSLTDCPGMPVPPPRAKTGAP